MIRLAFHETSEEAGETRDRAPDVPAMSAGTTRQSGNNYSRAVHEQTGQVTDGDLAAGHQVTAWTDQYEDRTTMAASRDSP